MTHRGCTPNAVGVRSTRTRTVVLGAGLLAITAWAMLLSGCGYGTRGTYPREYRSVSVPIFENRSFYRGFERDLTEALIKEIELQTPYKAVARAGAQTELTGSIVGVSQVQLSRRYEGGLPQEMEVRVGLNYEWRDVRSGQLIRERKGFEVVARYVPAKPVGETLEAGQAQAAAAAARAIVATMRSDW